jgi:formylglycine-generating enzyme required for sulfatase activity
MSTTPFVIALVLISADPTADQLALLKTFRGEFVQIEPASSNLALFAIAKYEVPQNLWQSVMGDNPSRWKGPRNSVEMISLEEARQFCRRVTPLLRSAGLIKEDDEVRLPTEAEWEHAARAGTTTTYSFGDDPSKLGDYAWFTGNAAGNDPAVGAKKPNPWGLYDIHGYLWEWTIESPLKTYSSSTNAVIRGGSWKDKADALVSSSRRVVPDTLRDDAVGFRCVLAKQASGRREPPGTSAPLAKASVDCRRRVLESADDMRA